MSPEGTYRGMRDCVRQVLQHEGVRAFYKGLLPSLVRPLQSMAKGTGRTGARTQRLYV